MWEFFCLLRLAEHLGRIPLDAVPEDIPSHSDIKISPSFLPGVILNCKPFYSFDEDKARKF